MLRGRTVSQGRRHDAGTTSSPRAGSPPARTLPRRRTGDATVTTGTIGRFGAAMLAALLSAAGTRADEPASPSAPAASPVPSIPSVPSAPPVPSVPSAPPPDAAVERMTRRDVHQAAAEAVDAARRWIEAGEPGKALAVLHEAMRAARAVGGVDTTSVRFMAAQALLKMGRPHEAAEILAQLAEEHPAIDRVRLDYAASLFAIGRDEDAEAVFREVWGQEDLPPAVRRNVERFLQQIRARRNLRIDLDVGLWWDDNVNNAPERETVEVPLFGGLEFTVNERPVRAWVARAGAGLRWRRPVTGSGRTSVETRASVARNTARNASAYNRTWANASIGPRVRYAVEAAGRRRPGTARADVGVERRWRGGEPYAVSLWGGLGLDQTVNESWRFGLFTRYWSTRHDEGSKDRDPPGRRHGLYLTLRAGPGDLTAGGAFSRETPARRDLRWRSREAWLGYAADVGRDVRLSVRIHGAETSFGGVHRLFMKRRRDHSRGASLTISDRSIAWRGYLPELTLDWTRTRSNVPLYERQGRTLRIGLRRLF